MNNKVKMIVTDLDDTLLRNDKTISNYTKSILYKVKEKGIYIVFATARGNSYKRFFDENLFNGYVLMNGARSILNGKVIDTNSIEPQIYKPYLNKLQKLGLKVAAESTEIHYSNIDGPFSGSYQKYIKCDFTEENIEFLKADKLYTYLDDETQFKSVLKYLPDSLHIKRSRDGMIMIMNENASKINGIKKIVDKLDIKLREIVCFGDDYNDIDMLLQCGKKIAMKNAIDEVKEIADEICGSNEEDGVCQWIDKNLNLDKE